MSDYYPQIESEDIYNAFLYEPIADQDNGTPVSVLTALARGNHDPWEEAARLARLAPDRAERELVRMLDGSVGRALSLAELESAAKRLVPMLPFRKRFIATAAAMPVATDATRQLVYWVVWFGIVVMLIVAQAHERPPSNRSGAPWAGDAGTARSVGALPSGSAAASLDVNSGRP